MGAAGQGLPGDTGSQQGATCPHTWPTHGRKLQQSHWGGTRWDAPQEISLGLLELCDPFGPTRVLVLPGTGSQVFTLSLKCFLRRLSLFHCQAGDKLFSATEVALWMQWVSGCSSVLSHTVFTTRARKNCAQEMFTYWELNFNICSLANESEVQFCSLLHSMNLESTPDDILH